MSTSSLLERAKRAFWKAGNKLKYRLARHSFEALDHRGLVNEVRKRKLTYLSKWALFQIIRSLRELDDKKVEGIIIEAGCALGGSLVVIAGYSGQRAIREYDTFEMIPAPTADDPAEVHERYETIVSGQSKGIGGETYYGYRGDLLDFVKGSVEQVLGPETLERVAFHKGLLQDRMVIDGKVAFAHIDVDWYDPVCFCLEHIWPALSVGGIMILDDYYHWGGCRKAVDAYFAGRTDYRFDGRAGTLKVTKTR